MGRYPNTSAWWMAGVSLHAWRKASRSSTVHGLESTEIADPIAGGTALLVLAWTTMREGGRERSGWGECSVMRERAGALVGSCGVLSGIEGLS
jgi:hypothetical protein